MKLVGLSLAIALSIAPVSARAEALPPLRILQYPDDLSPLATQSCARALEAVARSAGYTTKSMLSDAPEVENASADDGAINIRVLPTTGSGRLLAWKPDGIEVLDDVAAFPSPRAFAGFLKSPLYDELFKTPYISSILPFTLAGLAYGNTAQIISRDKPILTPDDLRGRTMVGSFGVWWYADIKGELGIGHDPALGWATQDIAGQRQALVKAMAGYGAPKAFVVMPLLTAAKVVPPELRTYLSLSMSHVGTVSFFVDHDNLDDARLAPLMKLIKAASLTCSAQNFEAEQVAIDQMKRSGTTIVPVDVAAFQKLSVIKLQRELGEAKATFAAMQVKYKDKGEDAKYEDEYSTAEHASTRAQETYDLYTRLQAIR